MARISAANNLTIEYDEQYWRLLTNGAGIDHVLVEAATGKPLSYMPTFGSRRKLPTTGKLPTQYIDRVVLGWSAKDEAWHLGLMLQPELAEARGSRWCEIAHWYDPQHNTYDDLATQAGERLAEALMRPFNFIPPRVNSTPAQVASPPATAPSPSPEPVSPYAPPPSNPPTAAAEPYAPPYPAPYPAEQPGEVTRPKPLEHDLPVQQPTRPVDLPPLPLSFDVWVLDRPDGATYLEFKRVGSWARARVWRIFWYTLWAVVYIVLSIATLRAPIAPPRPEWLPYLGLASAGVLVLLIMYLLWQLSMLPNRYIVDPARRAVIALHGRSQRWIYALPGIESVYVTQVVSRRSRGQRRTIHYSELNLHIRNGSFRHLVSSSQAEDKDTTFEVGPVEEAVMQLLPEMVDTDMKAAGFYVAQTLGVPAYYDQRLK